MAAAKQILFGSAVREKILRGAMRSALLLQK